MEICRKFYEKGEQEMKLRKVLAAILAATMLLSTAACQSGETTSSTDESSATESSTASEGTEESSATEGEETTGGEMDEVQELNLVFSDLATLDVNDARNANEFQVMSHIFEGLFRTFTDENGNDYVENAGAESFTVSEDGLVYTYTLKDQVWTDGVAVTAQQYVDSIIRLLDPVNAFSYSFLAYDIVNAEAYYNEEVTAEEVGVKAIDDKTLEITLHTAIPFFNGKLTNVCFYPIRLDVIDAAGDLYATDFEKHVFNGPFVIESRILENEMILAKNESYWDAENVHLTKVTLKEVAEASTQSLLIQSKELDVVTATSEYIASWQENENLTQITKYAPSVNYMSFNQHTGGPTELMNNAKVRLAFSLAIDRVELNELIYEGINTPAYGIVPDGIMVGDTEYRTLNEQPLLALLEEYDTPEKIQALLVEGIEEEGKDASDLSAYEFTIISIASSTQAASLQEYYRQTWEEVLGVKINTNMLADSSLFVEERNNNRYDLVNMGWNGDYNDPLTFMELWNTDSGYAKFMGGYSNAEFDDMFNQLATLGDEEARAELYVKMENNLIAENAGTAPLYFTTDQYFVQNYVKNLSTPMFGTEFEFSRAYISGK